MGITSKRQSTLVSERLYNLSREAGRTYVLCDPFESDPLLDMADRVAI